MAMPTLQAHPTAIVASPKATDTVDEPLPESEGVPWRHAAVFAVKLIHSAIFLGIAAGVLHIFYAGITGRTSRLTKVAVPLTLGECLVFAANRFRCPLTQLAEQLGAESGQVTDIFLPRWLADRIPWIFTPPLIAGLLGLLRHGRHSPASGNSGKQRMVAGDRAVGTSEGTPSVSGRMHLTGCVPAPSFASGTSVNGHECMFARRVNRASLGVSGSGRYSPLVLLP